MPCSVERSFQRESVALVRGTVQSLGWHGREVCVARLPRVVFRMGKIVIHPVWLEGLRKEAITMAVSWSRNIDRRAVLRTYGSLSWRLAGP